VGVSKISGNFTWGLNHGIESDKYNPNDLGILFGNNNISQGVYANYNKYKPFWKVNNLYTYFNLNHSLLYKPTRYQNANVAAGFNTTFTKNFLSVGMDFDANPVTHDYYEPRQYPLGDYFVRLPANANIGGYISSDYRKKLALDIYGGVRRYGTDDRLERVRPRRMGYGWNISPRYRVNNQLNFRYTLDWNLKQNQVGYVNGGLDNSLPDDAEFRKNYATDVLLGRRRVLTVTNTLSGAYTFNNRMSLTIRTRHYTSTVNYADFARLGKNGQETLVDYRRNRDNTFNAFNVDAVYSWWFAPGSQVSIVWKNASSSFLEANEATPLYFDNLNNTINTPHNNNISIKILYYLDYLMIKRKLAS
jgi:hypothetical protein